MNSNLAEALKRLPHGPEFRFVDRLVSLEPGQRGVAEYTVRGDEFFCADISQVSRYFRVCCWSRLPPNSPASSRKAIRKFHHCSG